MLLSGQYCVWLSLPSADFLSALCFFFIFSRKPDLICVFIAFNFANSHVNYNDSN